MKNIVDVKSQSLSSLISTPYSMCENCHIVDFDNRRLEKGFRCPICDNPGDGGYMYFYLNINVLLDIIQTAYH